MNWLVTVAHHPQRRVVYGKRTKIYSYGRVFADREAALVQYRETRAIYKLDSLTRVGIRSVPAATYPVTRDGVKWVDITGGVAIKAFRKNAAPEVK